MSIKIMVIGTAGELPAASARLKPLNAPKTQPE